jgi:hypothetical protein
MDIKVFNYPERKEKQNPDISVWNYSSDTV